MISYLSLESQFASLPSWIRFQHSATWNPSEPSIGGMLASAQHRLTRLNMGNHGSTIIRSRFIDGPASAII